MGRPKVVSLVGDRSHDLAAAILEQLEGVRVCLVRLEPPPRTESRAHREILVGGGAVCDIRRYDGGVPELILSLSDCRVVVIEGGPVFAPTIVADSDPASLGDVPYLLGVVGSSVEVGTPSIAWEEVGKFVLERVPEYPAMLNCGECGYRTCAEFLEAAIRGKDAKCVVEQKTLSLRVDGREIQLIPFMENQLKTMTLAYLSTLKGVPENPREVILRVGLEGGRG